MSEQDPQGSDEIIEWMKERHPERFDADGRAVMPTADQIIKPKGHDGPHGIPLSPAQGEPDE
jgi:hypothetical protein